MLRRVLGASLLAAAISLCFLVPAAMAGGSGGGSGNVTCTGTAPTSVPGDLIVPNGTTCIVLFASTIGHDIVVLPGGSLDDRGAYVHNDILANQPVGIHVNGGDGMGPGTVGGSIVINGVTGTPYPPTENSLCNTIVGGYVVVSNSASTAAPWDIGDRGGICGGGAMAVGQDMSILHNANPVTVKDNSPAFGGNIGHDLIMLANSGGVVAANNSMGNDCAQGFNSPYAGQDNTTGGPVNNCNS